MGLLALISCSTNQVILQRDYKNPNDFLNDYLKIPKIEETGEIPEIALDQKNYGIEFIESNLANGTSFMLTKNWKVDSDGKLLIVVEKNNDYQNLGAETLILKEFLDALFAFGDSPEQGLYFYSQILSSDVDSIEEHLRRRLKGIDFQPAATFLDDFYQSLYLPSLRRALSLTAKWKRFEASDSPQRPFQTRWSDVITSWLNINKLEHLNNMAQERKFTSSVKYYFEQMQTLAQNPKSEKVLMFYPLSDESHETVDILAEGLKEDQPFFISPNESLIDLIKNHNEWGTRTMFLSLYTTIDSASKKGAGGVAGVLVEKNLLLPQSQGLFAGNVWLYPIGLRKKQILFKANLRDLRLSRSDNNKPRLAYFLPPNERSKPMKEYEKRDEFQHEARIFYLRIYQKILGLDSL